MTVTYGAATSRPDVRPFQPFRAATPSGEGYEVRHPEMAFPTRTEMVIGIPIACLDDDGSPGQ